LHPSLCPILLLLLLAFSPFPLPTRIRCLSCRTANLMALYFWRAPPHLNLYQHRVILPAKRILESRPRRRNVDPVNGNLAAPPKGERLAKPITTTESYALSYIPYTPRR
jgi:hypothetical protein